MHSELWLLPTEKNQAWETPSKSPSDGKRVRVEPEFRHEHIQCPGPCGLNVKYPL